MAQGTLTLSDGEFDAQVLKSGTPTLVDFWAEWCAPCRALTPVIDQVAQNYAGKVQIGKMNIDDNPETPSKYAVRAIPTLILFKNGKVADQLVGLVSKQKLEEMLAKHV